MKILGACCDVVQIRALLWKDFLVRIRQPWMTIIQYLWPCLVFASLFILRSRFQPTEIGACQYPARQLPTKNQLLPFFQSYICSIENQCLDVNKYDEGPNYESAFATPILQIVQLFLNEEALYYAITNLPVQQNILTTVGTLVSHPRFKEIEAHANTLITRAPEIQKFIGTKFDVKKLFADNSLFSKTGKILCDRPFPKSNNIRYVENLLYTPDYNGPDAEELEAMPTPYCKQLYLDVTNSNFGKITWKHLKPIIQGKIVYGPDTERNRKLMFWSNTTYLEMGRLREFVNAVDQIIKIYRVNPEFQKKISNLVEVAKTEFVQALVGGRIDTDRIEAVLNGILKDDSTETIVHTIYSILECFSVDRYIGVNSTQQFEDVALELNAKKLYFGGVYFNETNNDNEIAYSIRMDVDNTPVTIENRNRFWFPGAEGSFELDMRYHRGFIQMQHSIDTAIIKYQTNNITREREVVTEAPRDEFDDFDFEDDEVGDEEKSKSEAENTTAIPPTTEDLEEAVLVTEAATLAPSKDIADDTDDDDDETKIPNLLEIIKETFNVSESDLEFSNGTSLASLQGLFDLQSDESSEDAVEVKNRTRRQAVISSVDPGLLSIFQYVSNSTEKHFAVDDEIVYTKQFPYPKYVKDDFKRGLYLAQAVQIAFFVALLVQVASSVRHKIWMKESGNCMLMRVMGLRKSSENISWAITSLIEVILIFLLSTAILYIGGILYFTGKPFLCVFLIVYGLAMISFCYMVSTFFASASIGSVSAVILFLTTFLPYIIIISLGATLNYSSKLVANLSFSTAFCYAWHFVFRRELQQVEVDFETAFSGTFADNDFKFSFTMLVIDAFIYLFIGFMVENFKTDSFRFHKMRRMDLDSHTGAILQNVTKSFDSSKVPAVSNFSMNLRKDYITTLLGRNGAGKSTIIKMLTGQVLPTSGDIFMPQKYDLISGNNIQEQVGLCSQNNVLIPNLTAAEHLELFARIKMRYGFGAEVSRILETLSLGKYENYRSCELSGGFKRRLCIANAFIGSPNVVILDEPCSGVDTKARKHIWELIKSLKQGRAVVLATHYLDEAEHLSDNVVMMSRGHIVAENTPSELRNQFTKTFQLKISFVPGSNIEKVRENIFGFLATELKHFEILDDSKFDLTLTLPYRDKEDNHENVYSFIKNLEELQTNKQILEFRVKSKNLQDVFNEINEDANQLNGQNGKTHNGVMNGECTAHVQFATKSPTQKDHIRNLFWKRFLHFRRNFRLLLCVLVLPTLFEVIAMAFMNLRPPGGHTTILQMSRDVYLESKEFYSYENGSEYASEVYGTLVNGCGADRCEIFNSSQRAFKWILDTHNEHIEKRYGGLTFNTTTAAVWYNNKGYHAMPSYLNELNRALLKSQLKDDSYDIKTYNHPLSFGQKELGISSILQQIADAGIALILLVAFSLVAAGCSVYIVSERVSGEKLQQKLSGVGFRTYWGVAFVWDFVVFLIAILLAVIVFQIFAIPIYVDKDDLAGIVILLTLYGLASIPMVHLCEKLFSEASFANMSIFCLNVIIALFTITIILMMDVLGESDETERLRNILNRVFLIFPQHAFADALIEICKNYIQSEIFIRYYINTYKSPVTSDLLHPHFLALILHAIIFTAINYVIESGYFQKMINKYCHKSSEHSELKIISIQNTLQRSEKSSGHYGDNQDCILKVENLTKSYSKKRQKAIDRVSFNVKRGECFGLLGTNGAGKSTVFSILSGQMDYCSGKVEFFDADSISYCPQNNPLDSLLTVEEVIAFYARLKKFDNVERIIDYNLKFYHLEQYRDVLVKNLSGGNRRKLTVAVTCFGKTPLVLMDEPTSDMDPVTRSLVYKSIDALLRDRRSILLTSHTISEIDTICNRIAVLRDGHLISTGTPEQLKIEYGSCYAVTIFYDKIESLTVERDIREEFPMAENIQTHTYTLQFIVKIRSSGSDNPNSILLSDLLNRLHNYSVCSNVQFTVSECLLDQAFESILESHHNGYSNHEAYSLPETAA